MSVKGKHLIHYVPHGIDSQVFKPVDFNDTDLIKFKKSILGNKDYDFICLYNSRNIGRKRTSNIMLAFRTFCDNLPKEKADKCLLILHTERVLDAGTDLDAINEAFLRDKNLIILENRFTPVEMNLLYNLSDVTINISSNEGFGLSIAESIMCGTPIIVNVTGGLQDQIGQLDDGGNPVKFSVDFGSNNVGRYTRYGIWAKPIWPVTRVVQGSPMTPYIFDDLCKWEDAADAMMYWYLMPKSRREECGLEGRRWAQNEGGLNNKNLAERFISGMDFTINNFKRESAFSLHTSDEYVGNLMPDDHLGFEIPKIDVEKIKKELSI